MLGKRIVLLGFIVPTAINEERNVTEFFFSAFLVPAYMFLRPRLTRSFMLPTSKDFSWTICMTLIISWESFLGHVVRHELADTLPTA